MKSLSATQMFYAPCHLSRASNPYGIAFLEGVDDDANNSNNGCVSSGVQINNSGTITGEMYLNDPDGAVGGTVGGMVILGTGDCGGACAAASSCPGNTLLNAGFETGDFTGWTITPGYGPGNDDVLLNSTPPGPFTNVQGLYYGVIISDNMNNPNVIYQDVVATAGTVANLSVYAAVHNPANNSEIKLQFLDAANTVLGEFVAQVDEDVDISGTFQLYTLSGTAPTGTTKVRALASTSANTYSNGGPSFKTDAWCLTLTTLPCALTAAGKTLEACNNNATTGTGADDYIIFSLNPSGTGLGASYSLTVNGGGTVTLAGGGAATGIAYGAATAFRLQNGSANGTLYTITVTDVSGAPCTVTTTVQQSAYSTCAPLPCGTTTAVKTDKNPPLAHPARRAMCSASPKRSLRTARHRHL